MLLKHRLHFFASKQVVSFATEQSVTYLRNAQVSPNISNNSTYTGLLSMRAIFTSVTGNMPNLFSFFSFFWK